MLPYSKVLIHAACLALPFTLVAQHDPLSSANAAFLGEVSFKIDKHQRLVVDHFDAGVRFRQDIAPIADLDAEAICYSEEEDALVLKCLPDKPQCLSKEIFKLDVVRLTSRATLARPSADVGGAQTIGVLQELIRTTQGELVQAGP